MSTVAIIPARGGSQGVPGKNLRPIGGVPLIGRAVRACRAARRIDHIFVTTDDEAIAQAARLEGAEIIRRPAELAGNTASSESALLHALDEIADLGIDAQTLVFVQCTSPFIDPHDLDQGVSIVANELAESAFSGVETYEFLWRDVDPDKAPGSGAMVGQNHQAAVRPRRQDRRPDFRETGAFYILDVAGFRRAQHRFFGTTRVVPVSELASLEIDTAEELALADAFAGVLDRPTADGPLDVDVVFTVLEGVHTSNTIELAADGSAQISYSHADALGLQQLAAAGVPVVVVRHQVSEAVLEAMGLQTFERGSAAESVRVWLARHGVDASRAAFVGSDIDALAAMELVGWPVAVPGSPARVHTAARVILNHPGGDGAVREVCDRVLAARAAGANAAPGSPRPGRPQS